jgi:phage terminase large subunit-like protein
MAKPLTRGGRVIAFIEGACVVPEGKLVGKPMRLDPFQKQFILDIYDNPVKTKRGLLSIARKNGKTGLIAGILLAHIAGPEAVLNTQIVSGALSRDQAALVYGLAEKMINLSPLLRNRCRTIPSKKMIFGLALNVEYKALSADASTAHGLSPVLAILDEVGQIKGPTSDFVEAITTSQGAHESPLLIAISTSSANDADMFSTWCDDAIRSGDPHIVCHVHKADEGCDLLDETQWKKANPALGTFRSEEDLRTQLEQASRLPSMEASVRNLLLNQRVAQEALFMAPDVWKRNSSPPDLAVLRKCRVAIGLDLSARNDLTAAVCAGMDDDGFVHLVPFVFCPRRGIEERSRRDRVPYADWVKSGQLIPIGGESMDYRQITQFLRDRLADEGIEPSVIAFDRWRIEDFKVVADELGFASLATWKEVGQGFRDFAPRCDAFMSLMLEGRVRHGGHPLLNMAAANAVAVVDAAGGTKLDKSKATQRIDPLVAAVMAVYEVSEGQGVVMGSDLSWWVA